MENVAQSSQSQTVVNKPQPVDSSNSTTVSSMNTPSESHLIKNILFGVLCFVIVGGVGGLGYYWGTQQVKKTTITSSPESTNQIVVNQTVSPAITTSLLPEPSVQNESTVNNSYVSKGFYVWREGAGGYTHFSAILPQGWIADEMGRLSDEQGRYTSIALDFPLRLDLGEGITSKLVSSETQMYPVGTVKKDRDLFENEVDKKQWYEERYSLIEAKNFPKNESHPLLFIALSSDTEADLVVKEKIVEEMWRTIQLQ